MTTSVQNNVNPTAALYASLNGTSNKASTTAEVDPQDRFLKLLVTQLKNQDPLNPMDNQAMTSQLAQISTVDGINKLNATLQALVGNATQTQLMQAAALVGHGVLVPGSGLELQSGAAVGGVNLDAAAEKVNVTIKDSSGLVVKTIDLGAQLAGAQAFAWDGTTDNGSKAADGKYTISVSATNGSDKVTASTLQVGVVSSVVNTGQGATLNVAGIGSFGLSDVKQIQ